MIVTVCAAGCDFASLASAARHVPAGSTIVVRSQQHGGVTLDRAVTVRGTAQAIVSGGSAGLTITAPHVVVDGLTLRGYGMDENSGRSAAIVVRAADATLRNNRFEDNMFAVVVQRAPRARILGNSIRGLGPQIGGDSIRVWYSPGAAIERNTIDAGRDILVSYSSNVRVTANLIRGSRYGLHDMFSDRMLVRGNTFENDEIGANFMYARHVTISNNAFLANHGATGYGVGLEDVDASAIAQNRFDGNHVALSSVDSPSNPALPDTLDGNTFTHNGSALSLQSDPHALVVVHNAFVDNLEDVEVSGGGLAAGVTWSSAGRGNYWSAYAGYDRNGDRIGDVPYAPRAAFDAITDTHPELQMFRYSPAAMAVEFAARALPATASQPKLTDSAPLLAMPADAATPARKPNPLPALLALLSVIPLAALRRVPKVRLRSRIASSNASQPIALDARSVRKLYARERGVRDITLRVHAGESVALWGANGAGKTTFFRCILGERLDAGTLQVYGRRPSPHDRLAREAIGYAPQHLPDFDASVGEMAELIAGIRGAADGEVQRVLALVDLSAERARSVNELSGGMRQRLSIALALIGDPPVLLLDEPTAGLDRASRQTVIALLKSERERGKTLIFTSHLLEDVCELADRVVTLDNGVAIESQPSQAFAASYLRNIS